MSFARPILLILPKRNEITRFNRLESRMLEAVGRTDSC
jgi:hypothetical protein